MALPCKFVWSVALRKWVGDSTNGTACPAEETCDSEGWADGTFDGEVKYGGCLAEQPETRPVPGRRKGRR